MANRPARLSVSAPSPKRDTLFLGWIPGHGIHPFFFKEPRSPTPSLPKGGGDKSPTPALPKGGG